MPCSAYVGLTGSGKSYNAVKNVIVPALKSNRKVFTNIPMHDDLCEKELGNKVISFTTQDLIDNPDWFQNVFESGSILVFDEAWELWPAGMTASKILVQHKTFIAKHRHDVNDDGFSTEIIFCTQDLAQLAPFATMLIDFTYVSNSLEDRGSKNRIRVDIYKGNYKGTKVSDKQRQREYFDKIQWKKVGDAARYYISNTNGNGSVQVNEKRSDTRFNAFGGFKTKLFFIAIIFFGLAVYALGKNFYQTSDLVGHSNSVTTSAPVVTEQPTIKTDELSNLPKPIQQKELIKVDELDLISQSDNFYISGKINNEYYFKFRKGDAIAYLSSTELTNLNYEIVSIDECLVKIIGFKKVHFKFCQDNSNNNDFIRTPI